MAKGSGSTRLKQSRSTSNSQKFYEEDVITTKERNTWINKVVSEGRFTRALERENSPSISLFGGRIHVDIYNSDIDKSTGTISATIEVSSGRNNRTTIETSSYRKVSSISKEAVSAVKQHIKDFSVAMDLVDEYIYDKR